jgi:hypothetical protein
MKRLRTTAALRPVLGTSLAALLVMGISGGAHATVGGPFALSGSYTVSVTTGTSPFSMTNVGDLGGWVGSANDYQFTENLGSYNNVVGLLGGTSAAAFLTLSPTPGSGDCSGGGCVQATSLQQSADPGFRGTETSTVTVQMSFTIGTVTDTLTQTGVYTAKYGGVEASCSDSGSTGTGPNHGTGNNTDCIVWDTIAQTTATHVTSPTGAGGTVTDTLNFNGEKLLVTFINAEDWTIYPGITFDAQDAPAPEPMALALFGVGLLGLGTIKAVSKKL